MLDEFGRILWGLGLSRKNSKQNNHKRKLLIFCNLNVSNKMLKIKIQQARLFLSYKVKYCVMRNPFFLQGRPKLHRYRVMKFAIETSRNEEVTWNPTCFLSRYFHIPNKRRNVHLRIQKFASFFVTSHISFLEKTQSMHKTFQVAYILL